MKYETTVTSKGTITIAAAIRKELHIKSGQKLRLFVNRRKNVEIDAGISMEEFEAARGEILRSVKIPDRLKGLSARELRDLAGPKAYD